MKKLYFIFLNFFLYICIQAMEEQLLLSLNEIICNKEYSQRWFSRFQLSDEEELDILNEVSKQLTGSLDKKLFQVFLNKNSLISSALLSIISKMANYCAHEVQGNTIETISSTGICAKIPHNMKNYLYYKALKLLRGWRMFTIELPYANANGLLCLSEACYKIAVENNKRLLLYCLKTMATQDIAPLTSTTNYALFNRNGTYVALANNSNKVTLYNSCTGELIQEITYPINVTRLYFSPEKDSLFAYYPSSKYTYISSLQSNGIYDAPEKIAMKPSCNFIITKIKNYEVVPFLGKVTINKKLSSQFIVCLKAIDNTIDKKSLSTIKNTKIFKTLDLVEQDFFNKYTQDKVASLKQIESSRVHNKKLNSVC